MVVKYMKLQDVVIKFSEMMSGFVQYTIKYDEEEDQWAFIEHYDQTRSTTTLGEDIRVTIDRLYLRFKYSSREAVFGYSLNDDNADEERAEYSVEINGCRVVETSKPDWHDVVHTYLDECAS